MKLSDILSKAQSLAPSYLEIQDDGSKYRCDSCDNQFHADRMLKIFTPDGKSHYCTCIDCIDEDWLKSATNVSTLLGVKI